VPKLEYPSTSGFANILFGIPQSSRFLTVNQIFMAEVLFQLQRFWLGGLSLERMDLNLVSEVF